MADSGGKGGFGTARAASVPSAIAAFAVGMWAGRSQRAGSGKAQMRDVRREQAVGELRRLLENDEAEITVSVSETKIRFLVDGLVLTSKVIDGAFPDYTRVIPTGNTRRMEVDAADFAAAVDRVATISQERSRAVKLTMDEDKLTLSVNSPDAGSAAEELVVAYPDEPMEIGFNAKYLLEIAQEL